MFKITVKTNNRKGSVEVINANMWLAYHMLHALYGVEESTIDEAFKRAEKEPCLIEHDNKTFTVEIPEYHPERARHEISGIIHILESTIQNSKYENKDLISLASSFVQKTNDVLNLIKKVL